MLLLLALWVLFSAGVGVWARNRGRSLLTWLLVSAVVSPVIAAIVLSAMRDLSMTPEPVAAGRSRIRRFLRWVFNIALAVVALLIFISALNRGGMKPIQLALADQAGMVSARHS